MGNSLSQNLFSPRRSSRKRKCSAVDNGVEESDCEDETFSPKRRKLMSTAKYIYKTLFEEGQGSDVKIIALNKEWNLHRIYLSQSPYFNSMFNGIWVETNQKEINIGIEDANITTEALHIVFGSLYQDEIVIKPSEAVSVLACATLLQLDDLINQSIEVMKDSVNIETALSFYEASELYGLTEVKGAALNWLCRNFVLKLAPSPKHLSQISSELMIDLLSSADMLVIQTEFSLYMILKTWVYLRENPSYKENESLLSTTEEYFKSFTSGIPFLSSETGLPYQPAFRALRLKYLVVHHVDMDYLENDNIIPLDWFFPIFKLQWYHLLRIDQGVDKGPRKLTEEDFRRECVRCGRVLNTDTQHSWRWTGFNFGFDIVIYYSRGSFKLRRFVKNKVNSHNSLSSSDSVSTQSEKRNLMYCLKVLSVDDNGKLIYKAETNINTVSLRENEQISALSLPCYPHWKFPLIVCANFLQITPTSILNSLPSNKRSSENNSNVS